MFCFCNENSRKYLARKIQIGLNLHHYLVSEQDTKLILLKELRDHIISSDSLFDFNSINIFELFYEVPFIT